MGLRCGSLARNAGTRPSRVRAWRRSAGGRRGAFPLRIVGPSRRPFAALCCFARRTPTGHTGRCGGGWRGSRFQALSLRRRNTGRLRPRAWRSRRHLERGRLLQIARGRGVDRPPAGCRRGRGGEARARRQAFVRWWADRRKVSGLLGWLWARRPRSRRGRRRHERARNDLGSRQTHRRHLPAWPRLRDGSGDGWRGGRRRSRRGRPWREFQPVTRRRRSRAGPRGRCRRSGRREGGRLHLGRCRDRRRSSGRGRSLTCRLRDPRHLLCRRCRRRDGSSGKPCGLGRGGLRLWRGGRDWW